MEILLRQNFINFQILKNSLNLILTDNLVSTKEINTDSNFHGKLIFIK